MTKKDLNEITLTIERTIRTETEPIRKMVEKHNFTLYGPEGNNGINEDVKGLKKFQSKVIKLLIGVTAIATFVGSVITKLLFQ